MRKVCLLPEVNYDEIPALMSNTFLNFDRSLQKMDIMMATGTDLATGSEAGSIGQDIGSVIAEWSDKLNADLENWYNDTEEIQALLDSAKSVVGEMKGIYQALQNYPPSQGGQLYFNSQQYNQIFSAMAALGIPQSQWVMGTLTSDGNQYHISAADLQQDFDLMIEYLRMDAPQFMNTISSLQQGMTKDMLSIMYDITAIKQNQQTLSGIWSALKQMAQVVEGNIQ
tara:strand:+ start:2364 stop:3041 length:678 start_codon:yes stop_codon:yes gene_type:complete